MLALGEPLSLLRLVEHQSSAIVVENCICHHAVGLALPCVVGGARGASAPCFVPGAAPFEMQAGAVMSQSAHATANLVAPWIVHAARYDGRSRRRSYSTRDPHEWQGRPWRRGCIRKLT